MFLHVVLFWDAYWTAFFKGREKNNGSSHVSRKKKQTKKNKKKNTVVSQFPKKKAIHRSRLCNQITFNEKKTVPLYNNDIN